jgi:GT2 family glycosyltransferase
LTKTGLSIVIVNFNAGAALRDTLQSLDSGLSEFDWEAVVVDNASTDGSDRLVEHADTRVRLLRQDRNLGFARAVNAGLAATTAPLVLVQNPDCSLRPGAVAVLKRALDAHHEAAVVGPRILNPDGTIQESARGDPNLLTGLFGRTTVLSRLAPNLAIVRRNLAARQALEDGAESAAVDWISGACMLARRQALSAVGGFDERYFLYWEDADLCRRLRSAGWTARYVPGAVVVHRVGGSSQSVPRLAIRAFHQSAYRYYVTHVVPQPWHPGRLVAWAILSTRSAFKQWLA